MKTGKKVKNFKNRLIFNYENEEYYYNDVYKLIKKLKYKKTSENCDYLVFKTLDSNHKCCVVIAFQDSRGGVDWKYNFDFFPTKVKAYKGWENKLWFHKGFYTQYQSARDDILLTTRRFMYDISCQEKINMNDVPIYIIGWSLGGAIAPICSEDIFYNFKIKPTVIAYEGANPCCSKHTKEVVDNSMSDNSICFVYGMDIVPRVPTFPFAYALKDRLYYLDDKKCKFPFILIKKFISMCKDTIYYHCNVDKGILEYMNKQ